MADVVELHVPARAALVRVPVDGQKSERSLGLETRDPVVVVPISAKLAREQGYPGFAEDDDGPPALSRRAFEERVDTVAREAAVAEGDAVRAASEKRVSGTSPASLLTKRQAVHTNIDYGTAHSTCSISGNQARELSYRYIFDQENCNLKVLPSGKWIYLLLSELLDAKPP